MSNFFTRPTATELTIAPGPLNGAMTVGVNARCYTSISRWDTDEESSDSNAYINYRFPPAIKLSDIPWGDSTTAGVYDAYNNSEPGYGLHDNTTQFLRDQHAALLAGAQAYVPSTAADAAAARAAQSAARAAYDAAIVVQAAKEAEYQAADTAHDALRFASWKASIALATAQRRGDSAAIAAATTARNAALEAAYAYSIGPLNAASGAASGARTARNIARSTWVAAVSATASADATAAGAVFSLSIVQLNFAGPVGENYQFAIYGEIGASGMIVSGGAAGGRLVARSDGADGGRTEVSDSTTGCVVGSLYDEVQTTGEYYVYALMPDDVYQAAKTQGLSLRLDWCEVTTTRPTREVTSPTYVNPVTGYTCAATSHVEIDRGAEPAIEYEAKSETMSMADAEQVGDSWRFVTDPITVDAPGGAANGSSITVSVNGPPTMPSCTVAQFQARGASRARQGFPEFTTPGDQPTAARYLTMTASGPGGYGGSLDLVAPPANYSPAGWPDDGRGGTLPFSPILFPWTYDYGARPLILADSFNLATDPLALVSDHFVPGGVPNGSFDYYVRVSPWVRDLVTPRSLSAVSYGVTSLGDLSRTLANPAGPTLTLSAAQTTADLQSSVEAVAGGEWPEPDIHGDYPVLPTGMGFNGAYRFDAPTGDSCARQKCRYKLTHASGDSREQVSTDYTWTSRWLERHRNLDTGLITDVTRSQEITLHGGQTEQTDADWREIAVPDGNESVEIIPQPGMNSDPRTFGGITATLG